MSQDVVSDGLNEIMNAKRAGKNFVIIKKYSKVLLGILAIGKLKNYIKNYSVKDKVLEIEFGRLNACKAVKPRYVVKAHMIEKYVRRYLPSRNMGVIIISTSQGLMTHQTAQQRKIGGSVVAYLY